MQGVRRDTLVRWHRSGFRRYWRWKSRAGGGAADQRRATLFDPADEHRKPTVGAPRIHGELLKLGFDVAQSNVAKYMVKRY